MDREEDVIENEFATKETDSEEDKKIPKYRLFTIFSLFFLAGIVIASFVKIDYVHSFPILLYSIFALILAAVVNFLLKNYRLGIVSLSLLGLITGLFYYSHFEYVTRPKLEYGVEKEYSGQIVKKPDVDWQKQKVILNIDGQKILVSLPHFPSVKYGDVVTFSGTIEKPGVIEGFDYGKYLRKDLVFGVVYSPKDPIAYSGKLSITQKSYQFLYSISDRFENSLYRILPEPHASLAAGLILGLKRNIPDSLKNDLSTTGLTHIIALSGYNVTIIVAVLADLLLGYISRKKVFILGTAFIFCFVILTGATSSVVRAAIFSFLVMLGKTIGRRADFTNIMILAALIMVLVNPFVIVSDVGFQLSFMAFAGLIYLSPIVAKLFERSRAAKIPGWFRLPLIETLSAQIAVFPLIMAIFGRVSIIGPLSNVAVLWIVPWSMGVSFVAGLLGIIYYPLGKLAAFVAWPVLEYIIKVVELFAKIPGASFGAGKGVWPLEISLYVLMIFLAIFLSKKLKVLIF